MTVEFALLRVFLRNISGFLLGLGICLPLHAVGCPDLLNYTFARLQDDTTQSLCQYTGKVILVVNTASFCGYTNQYKGLEALYSKYASQGFVVIGFPSNDFGQQEPGNAKQIADFCENTYGVKFPMMAKTSVKGSQANAFYQALIKTTGDTPGWNFHKYLINRQGNVINSYGSSTAPDNTQLVSDIEAALAKSATP